MNFIIAAGPVIIENNKVLLDKHGDDNFWKFPGGTMRNGETPEETAIRECKEELGISVELVRPVKPMLLWEEDKTIILIHYEAKHIGEISPGRHVREWKWHPVDALPDDIGPNIKPVLKELGY